MLVVADSSPLIVLISIGQAGILPTLFGQVFVPPEVIAELRAPARPAQVRTFVTPGPSWLVEKAPVAVENIPLLHAGELAAISLARELKADLLLIDDSEVERRRLSATSPSPAPSVCWNWAHGVAYLISLRPLPLSSRLIFGSRPNSWTNG
jgi:predicted nucleic acid-binding protein